jgi:hypothetical protein
VFVGLGSELELCRRFGADGYQALRNQRRLIALTGNEQPAETPSASA